MSAFSINQIYLVGNVSQEPELKHTKTGTAVLNFSMATNRSVQNEKKEWDNIPTFHRVIVFGKIAEFLADRLHKGHLVTVQGRQENRSYEDKDGVKKYVSEVIANSIIPMQDNKNSKPAQEAPKAQAVTGDSEIDNIDF